MNQNIHLNKDEFIGKHVTIIQCKDPTWVNKSGIIVDETKNTFLIERKNLTKRIAKKIATFEFTYHQKKIAVNGKQLTYRPEDRIKKAR